MLWSGAGLAAAGLVGLSTSGQAKGPTAESVLLGGGLLGLAGGPAVMAAGSLRSCRAILSLGGDVRCGGGRTALVLEGVFLLGGVTAALSAIPAIFDVDGAAALFVLGGGAMLVGYGGAVGASLSQASVNRLGRQELRPATSRGLSVLVLPQVGVGRAGVVLVARF